MLRCGSAPGRMVPLISSPADADLPPGEAGVSIETGIAWPTATTAYLGISLTKHGVAPGANDGDQAAQCPGATTCVFTGKPTLWLRQTG